MPRDLPLSNGRLLVAFGRDYLIRDIYYPHVGKENHATGHPFRFGVWTEGEFSWIGSDWQLDRRYAVDSMVTEVRARHEVLGIALLFHDAVDFYENVLVRHIGVTNLQDRDRKSTRLNSSHTVISYAVFCLKKKKKKNIKLT